MRQVENREGGTESLPKWNELTYMLIDDEESRAWWLERKLQASDGPKRVLYSDELKAALKILDAIVAGKIKTPHLIFLDDVFYRSDPSPNKDTEPLAHEFLKKFEKLKEKYPQIFGRIGIIIFSDIALTLNERLGQLMNASSSVVYAMSPNSAESLGNPGVIIAELKRRLARRKIISNSNT